MKTIEMKVGGRLVQFTPKSLVIDGAEFYYNKMSDIKHSASKHVYAFKYDGKVQYLQYDPKYEKGLKVIFGKINALGRKKAEAAAAAAAAQAAPAEAAPVVEPAAEEIPAVPAEAAPAVEPVAEEIPVVPEVAPAVEPAADAPEAPVSEAAPETAKAPEDQTVFDIPEEIKEPAAPAEAAPEAPAAAEGEGIPEAAAAEETTAVVPEGAEQADTAETLPEGVTEELKGEAKKGKLKKSLIVFACIIIVIGILSAVYFSVFGTRSNPTAGPNSTESQQYDDIDELIEDLDN